ncbi:MAG: hypothetical protein K1X83_09890 [Oligoflexia bacterium]|nr:hypothetical protein [Oligoflexia bacterium]
MRYSLYLMLLIIGGYSGAFAQVGTPCTCSSSGLPGRCINSSVTISQPGLYCLTQDIVSTSAFYIRADDVVLDGQGHKMTIQSDKFLGIAKGADPALPSFAIRTFNATVKNFNVVAKSLSFTEMIILDTVSNSTIENVTLKLIGGTSSTGAKLMGMYQSYLNRFVGNTFIMSAPSGGVDFFSIRNGTCGTQFINNTFVGSNIPSGHFIKLNSGDQTLGRNAVGDTIFSGNRIYSNLDGILSQSHEPHTGVTLSNNLIYASGVGFDAGSPPDTWFEVNGNTIISSAERPLHIGDTDDSNVRLGMKNNIFFAAGGDRVMDIHVERINSNYNNFFSTVLPPLLWSKYDGQGALLGNPTIGCLSGCANSWKLSWRDNNSVSSGPTLAALFVDPVVNLNLDSNDNPISLGDFHLKSTSGMIGIGEGGVNLGSTGGNGLNYPLFCGVSKPGLIPGDTTAPANPSNLRSSP